MGDLDRHASEIAERGFTIVENAIENDLVDEIADTLLRLEKDLGIVPALNPFEGMNTVRIYNLLVHGKVFEKIPVHPAILPIVERVLDHGCLISSRSSIAICECETPQPIHADDQLMPIPKPHPPTVCNTMWAITDFTEANGATRLMPGTHVSDSSPIFGVEYETIPAEMSRGSVLVWNGSLWHGGGANRADKRRVGIAMNYCAGFMRQQENQQLGIPLDLAATFEPRLQELCGFGIYNGLIGHIDKKPPAEVLFGAGKPGRVIWDRGKSKATRA
jgi:ectoine hydroxylase-related dioxygenase (phytanoyl-CoA dioxygenase family)